MMGKSGGGDRPIALTARGYRCWSAARKCHVADWETEWAGHWDKAVRKSDALRAAILRHVKSEIAVKIGASVVRVLWDCEKFYDLIDPKFLAEAAVTLRYPTLIMYMGMLIHLATRVVANASCLSTPSMPSISILAGCVQSVPWTRLYLWDILDNLHRKYFPTTIEAWVDDLAQQVTGSRTAVIKSTVEASSYLANTLQGRGARISAKACLLASDKDVGDEIIRQLESKGLSLKHEQTARDMGINASLKTTRHIHVAKARMDKACKRAGVIKGFLKINKSAKKLLLTGVRPQAMWGHQASGWAPTTLMKMRALFGACCGSRNAGGCTTTAIRMAFDFRMDPMVKQPVELLVMWVSILRDVSHLRSAIERIWDASRLRLLSTRRRWMRDGHIDAVIATLLDLGWDPIQPTKWTDEDDNDWALDVDNQTVISERTHVIETSADRRVWRMAAQHFRGIGLEHSADLHVFQKHLTSLRRAGRAQEA